LALKRSAMNSAWSLFLAKDDGLAQPVAARHFVAARHQHLQHLVHGVGVEQPLVHGLGAHLVGACAVFVPLQFASHCFALVVAQLGVLDALALELQRHRDGTRRH
jgi:hypothetical protein